MLFLDVSIVSMSILIHVFYYVAYFGSPLRVKNKENEEDKVKHERHRWPGVFTHVTHLYILPEEVGKAQSSLATPTYVAAVYSYISYQ